MVAASISAMEMARAVERLALLGGELLGVLQPGAGEIVEALRQDDGGGDDRAEETAAAHLVDAGDEAKAAGAQGVFGCAGADERLQQALLGGGGRDAARGTTRGAGHLDKITADDGPRLYAHRPRLSEHSR